MALVPPSAKLISTILDFTPHYPILMTKGPFNCYGMQWEWGCNFLWGKNVTKVFRLNVISVTRGWVGVIFPEKSVTRKTRMAPNWKFILLFYLYKFCSEFVTVSLFDHLFIVTLGMFGGALSFEDELSKRMVRQKEQIYASGATVLRSGNWD